MEACFKFKSRMYLKKPFILIFLIFTVSISCKEKDISTTVEFSFATHENKPLFVDEYLFNKETKKGKKLNSRSTEWFLIDWNGNGKFDELGIDYYGVKSPFKSRPILSILKRKNTLNHNGISYYLKQKSGFTKLEMADSNTSSKVSYISNYIPIELAGGEKIEKDVLENSEKTVIYFWASWCRPCVEKLVYMETQKEELNKRNINFIPIYYKSSYASVREEINKRNLGIIPIELSEKSGQQYQVGALPETYVFNRKGELVGESFDLKN